MIGLILIATAAGRVVWCAGAQPRARLGQYDLSLAIVPGDFVLLRVAAPDGAVVWEGRGDDDAGRPHRGRRGAARIVPDALLTELLNFGALGVFAAFLAWQHLAQQRRMDGLVESFQAQLREIDSGYERRIEVMRERYDAVIETTRERCREEKAAIEAQRDDLQKQLVESLNG